MALSRPAAAAARTGFWWQVGRWHRPLVLTSAGALVLTVIALVAVVVDHRTLLGEPIWLKPFKFSVSITVYAFTLAWMTSFLPRPARRRAWWIGSAIAAMLAVEMVVIIAQVLRGQRSHFNISTPLNQNLYVIMGVSIVIAWVLNLILAVALMRVPIADAPSRWAIRTGLVIALLGMAVGFLLVLPTSAQLDSLGHGVQVPILGAHSVGVPDGSAGIPITSWSLTGGDLRVPHFIGIHGLQVIPLLAIALGFLAGRIERLHGVQVRTRLVGTGAVAYAGLLLLTTWQALRGQSLVHPDAVTLSAAAVLVIGVLTAAVMILKNSPARVLNKS